MSPFTLAFAAIASALAGSGPWVVGEGQTDLYTGTEARRFSELAGGSGSFARDELIPVDEGVSTFGVKAILTYGLLANTEIDVQVPWYDVHANREDGAICTAVGLGACQTTRGLGVIAGHVRYNVLNELYGPPLSLTLGAEFRHGDLTSDTRQRITNLGEGTFDLGPVLSVGRSGGLGAKGYWYTLLDAGWRYRFPLTHADGRAVPGSEIYGEFDWLAVPGGRLGFGPFATLFWRPEGVDFADADLADVDRFGALRVMATQAGGKVTLRSGRKVTFSASASRTVYAKNNPLVTDLNLGLTVNDVGGKGR